MPVARSSSDFNDLTLLFSVLTGDALIEILGTPKLGEAGMDGDAGNEGEGDVNGDAREDEEGRGGGGGGGDGGDVTLEGLGTVGGWFLGGVAGLAPTFPTSSREEDKDGLLDDSCRGLTGMGGGGGMSNVDVVDDVMEDDASSGLGDSGEDISDNSDNCGLGGGTSGLVLETVKLGRVEAGG